MPVINRRIDRSSEQVYIGRGSPWGNPFTHLPAHAGKRIRTMNQDLNTVLVKDRREAVMAYRTWLHRSLTDGHVRLEDLAALDGKVLGCYCAPQRCHGDVLVKAAAWARKELLNS